MTMRRHDFEQSRWRYRRSVKREARGGVPADLGDWDGNVTIADRPAYVYARIVNRSAAPIEALRGPTPLIWDFPVLVDRTPDREWRIIDIDRSRARDFIEANQVDYVPWHTHNEYGNGLWDLVNPQRVQGGRVAPNGAAISVTTDGDLWYVYQGAHKVLEDGATLDLTAYQPASAFNWTWVKVGVDPASNALVATAGADTSVMNNLTIAALAAIAFDGYYPLGGVKLRGDATRFYDNDIVDLRFTTTPVTPGPLATGVIQQPSRITWSQTVIGTYQAVWHGDLTLAGGTLNVNGSVYLVR